VFESSERPAGGAAPRHRPARRRTTTKWGDRERRRADILDAARAHITEHGYLSLNMRDLAANAGVSPATLYSYFATKEVIFATLYVEAIRAYTGLLRDALADATDLETVLTTLLEHYLELYRTFGRHFTLWSAMRHAPGAASPPFPKELMVDLREATLESNDLVMASVRAAAARAGRRVIDEALVPAFLWTSLNGIADHFTSERRALDPFPPERLIRFSAQRISVAITTGPDSR
jgi:AcrR family transcriptional regulator